MALPRLCSTALITVQHSLDPFLIDLKNEFLGTIYEVTTKIYLLASNVSFIINI